MFRLEQRPRRVLSSRGASGIDGSGNFVGAGEQIFASQALNAGMNILTFMVPAGIPNGIATIGRFRLSLAGGLSYDGVLPGDGSETWLYSCSTANVQAGFNNIANVTAEEVGTDI